MEKLNQLIRLNQLQSDTQTFGQVETMTNCSNSTPDNGLEKTVIGRRKAVMTVFLERLQLDMGLPPLDDRVLVARAVSWEEHLTNADCKPEDYARVYELALQNYTNNAPFSIFNLLEAWRQIREADNYAKQLPKWESNRSNRRLKQAEKCPACNGTLMDFHRDENGKWLGVIYIEVDGEKQVAPCRECEGTGIKKPVEIKEEDNGN